MKIREVGMGNMVTEHHHIKVTYKKNKLNKINAIEVGALYSIASKDMHILI